MVFTYGYLLDPIFYRTMANPPEVYWLLVPFSFCHSGSCWTTLTEPDALLFAVNSIFKANHFFHQSKSNIYTHNSNRRLVGEDNRCRLEGPGAILFRRQTQTVIILVASLLNYFGGQIQIPICKPQAEGGAYHQIRYRAA